MLYGNHKSIAGHERTIGPNVTSEQNEQKDKSNERVRKRFTRKKLCLLLVIAFVILTVLLFFAVNIYHKPDLNELLRRAKLAKLPSSIKNLQIDTRPNLDDDGRPVPNTSEMYVRFEAEPNDIENFLNNSPGIDKNSLRPLAPLPDDGHVPNWWPADQSTSGRIYVIHEPKNINGMVAIYDDSNTTRIFLYYIVNPKLRDKQDMFDVFCDFLYDLWHEVLDIFD